MQYISPYKDLPKNDKSAATSQKQNQNAVSTKNTTSDVDKEDQSQQGKTLGQKMVEFIRSILGDKPKPINEDLVRDDI